MAVKTIARRWLAGVAVLSGAVIAPLIAAPEQPAVAPLACGITWTRTGGVWTYLPDCSQQAPPPSPPPEAPRLPPPEPPPAER
ncbi:hypothetical protein [Mycobacterium sp. Marseille-P9652]|uniref:hypothetical protein n=1 Tax=Mycobacterium sp. Marseille-P9652 TaxID=2654950 RepID=UPI0012E8B203|nr:hypothetical protein [Mycobacterium sp. Marseille-P9652]